MEDFIRIPKFYCHLMGVWPITKSKWAWIYYLHSIVTAYMVSVLFLISLTIDMYLSLGDLGVLADASYYFVSELTYMIKFMLFTFKRSKFVKLLEDIENPIFYSHLPEQEVFLKKWSKIATFYNRVYYGSCYICTVFYGIFPLIDNDNILPFRGWFPFDVQNNSHTRAFIYAFQLLGLAIAVAVNASLDVLPGIFMNISCAQIEILKDNLQNATRRAENLQNNTSIIQNAEFIKEMKRNFGENYCEPLSKEADDIVHMNLCKCVEHQKAIIKLLADVEGMFSMGMFIQFIATGIVMCITGLQFIMVTAESLKFVAITCYFVAVLLEITCYCWNGHQVIIQSSGIGDSCYNMDWYRCSTKVRKTIFIIMERCKKPMQVTAGYFFVLSIETLTAVVRTAYSYFAVLQSVYTD